MCIRDSYQEAPRGSVLIEAVHNTPWRDRHYAAYTYRTLQPTEATQALPDLTCRHVEDIAAPTGAYLLVTRSQWQAANLLGIGPPGAVQDFAHSCRDRPR